MKHLALSLILLLAACSSPQRTPARTDAVLSGDATARAASDAARAAEKKDDTGLIIASSEPAPSVAPNEPATQPTEPPTLDITLKGGIATIDGADVADLSATVREAAAATPGLVVRLVADETTPYARVVEVLDAVKAAGVEDVVLAPAPAADEAPGE